MASPAQTGSRTALALALQLENEQYAIPISKIVEVLPALPIESVPQCPRFVRGVVLVRGELMPVIDAAERLGLTRHQRPDEPHIVCLQVEGRIVGVEFDEALDLVELEDVESLDALALGAGQGFFAGAIQHEGGIIRLLNPDRLIGKEEIAEWTQVARTL